MHESRHVEGYLHTRCRHGALASTISCDPNYEYNGAYTVESEYLVKLARTDLLSADVRQAARRQAIENFKATFNEYPFGIQPGAILKTEQGSISFYDGNSLKVLPREPDPSTVLTLYYTQLFLISPLSGSIETYTFAQEPSVTGHLTPWVTNELNPEPKNSLLDATIHSSTDYSCYLFSDALNCFKLSNPSLTWQLKLHQIQPVQLVDAEKSKLLPDDGIYIVARNGYLYPLPSKFADLQRIKSEDGLPTLVNEPSFAGLGKWRDDQEIVLSRDGRVLLYSPRSRKYILAPGLENKSFKKLIAPFLWSKELEEI